MVKQQSPSITTYGTAARLANSRLKELIVQFNTDCEKGLYPKGELNTMRGGAIVDAIHAIEAATTQPELRRIPAR